MQINKKAMAAAVIAGALLLTSCSSGDDNDQGNEPEVEETVGESERDREETPDEPEDGGDVEDDDEPTVPEDDELNPDGGDGLDALDGFEGFEGLEGLGDLELPDVNKAVPLPDGFPSDVPLVEGTIFQADHSDFDTISMYSLAINAPGSMADVEDEAARLLTGAGFAAVDDPMFDFGADIDGFSMQTYEGSGDVSAVMVTFIDMDELGFTMVGYTIDDSDYDFDW